MKSPSPISDLDLLLRTLEPVLNPGIFAFVSLPDTTGMDLREVVASIREPEGLSVVIPFETAQQHALEPLFICAWITLSVNSDLQAIGLTAAFSTALGQAGISCNVVAGAYHDHIFVPLATADKAMQVLQALQKATPQPTPTPAPS